MSSFSARFSSMPLPPDRRPLRRWSHADTAPGRPRCLAAGCRSAPRVTVAGQPVLSSCPDGTMVAVRGGAEGRLTDAAGRLRSFRLFGGVSATVSGTEVDLVGPKPRLILAVLALEAGRTVSYD